MTPWRRAALLGSLFVAGLAAYLAPPYVTAAALVVRAAEIGAPPALARLAAREVDVHPPLAIPTRHGEVAAQLYVPAGGAQRTVLVMPGFNPHGISEPRLVGLATSLAASGVRVLAMALPDLQQFRLTPAATDVIEDAVAWAAGQPELAPDRQVGVIGVSFTGGLSIVAAGRPRVRDQVAFVVSIGGHGRLGRVMRYLATGEAPEAIGLETPPPHDYGVAVILHALADRIVPAGQAPMLGSAIDTFLRASTLTATDAAAADRMFARARELAAALPEPSRTYMGHVNDRAVDTLGFILAPHLTHLEVDDPALSPELATAPAAPVYLMHGRGDTIIPAAESVRLAEHLRERRVDVRLLLTDLITHAQPGETVTAAGVWNLISFWAGVLQR